jgi:flagellar protein FliO/FliZ
MEYFEIARFFGGLAIVISLIYGCAWLAKRFGLDKKLRGATGAHGRLAVADVMYIDPKRKLMLVRADASEYLLLISGESVTVVDKMDVAK